MSRPRLQGLAKQMTLRHMYQTDGKERAHGFYRFMLLNQSTLSIAHHFLSRMRLSILFMEYSIRPKDCQFLQIRSDSTIIALLRLTKPADFRLVFTKEYNTLEREWIKKEMLRLMPYLEGVRKLEMPADSKLLFVLQMLADQLEELWCADQLLNSDDCPLLELKKLKIGVEFSQMSYRVRLVLLVCFRHLFRHKIRHLDLCNFNFDSFYDCELDSENAGQRSVESLRLHVNERCLHEKVLPFVLNFHKQMPCFNELELIASNVHCKIDEADLSAQLLEVYQEIMEFKEKTKHFLKKLLIRFEGFEFGLKRKIELNWPQKLKESAQFHSVHYMENSFDNVQVVQLQKFEPPLTLNIRFELNVNNEQQWSPFPRDDDE